MDVAQTPSKAAFKFTKILDLYSQVHEVQRFPVDVEALAKDAANQFGWSDPITQVMAADIKGFEGALFANGDKSEWCLLYNHAMKSNGRIRFTQAHELGHYLLHRQRQDGFQCSEDDVINRDDNGASIEAEADSFAADLLMPRNDFDQQMDGCADFEALGACAERYGVSLTAATLRWLRLTDKNAVLIVHSDGYMNWTFSSKAAAKNGAFFKSRSQLLAIPAMSLAADKSVAIERKGIQIAANTWFPHARSGLSLREMKIAAREYDTVMSLLVLPRGADVWQPWSKRQE